MPMMADDEQNFFITEDVRPEEQDAIKEENESEDHQP
jgi:hypothetical protein